MRRLATLLLAAALAPVLVAGAQTETPEPNAAVIALQQVEAGGRRYTVDPFYLFNCFIAKRTVSLSTTEGSDALEAEIEVQCFVRDGDQMVAIDPFTSDDVGISPEIAVGQGIISAPQEPQPEEDALDG